MPTLKDVTAVLITSHPEYPKEIVLEGFGEIIVKTNSTSVYERYLQAAQAKNDIIFVQDDDCLTQYKELFKHYDGRITNAMVGRKKYYDEISRGRITLVGWGTFFPKSMLDSFKTYIDAYGVDAHLLREADRIFTWLNYPHNTIPLERTDLEDPNGKGRMSADPRHYESMLEAVKKLEVIAPYTEEKVSFTQKMGNLFKNRNLH